MPYGWSEVPFCCDVPLYAVTTHLFTSVKQEKGSQLDDDVESAVKEVKKYLKERQVCRVTAVHVWWLLHQRDRANPALLLVTCLRTS
jgi:hypothetical protein